MSEIKRYLEDQFENNVNDNMFVYNSIRQVPTAAQKKITGGRLNGMTDIKPMWRIEKLTELFGMCGIGWKTIIKNKEIIDGANGEKIAIVDIDLYIKIDGEWSEAIEGTGGSSFIANEKNGLYTSDECFKMAYTDALSVACKSLGMGADVYWGDSKYNSNQPITKEDAENYVLDFGKHSGKKLTELPSNYLHWLYENNDNCKQMIDLLGIFEDDKTIQQKTELQINIQKIVDSTGLDLDSIKRQYRITSLNDASLETLTRINENLIKHKEILDKVA